MDIRNHRMLEIALSMLEYISTRPDGASFTDICLTFSAPKSSTHSLLSTMERMGYLQKDTSNKYFIGLKAFELGSRFIENNDFYAYSRKVLSELVTELGETAHVAILEGCDVVYLSKFEFDNIIRMVSGIGKRIPAHASAVGKVLLSGKTDQELKDMYGGEKLKKLTDNTIDDLSILISQLEEIRRTGFGYEQEESSIGIRCIAVPVRDSTGKIALGMSISVPVRKGNLDHFKPALLNVKKKMERIL